MTIKIPEKTKENNKVYTKECKQIYETIRFAKIINRKLYPTIILCAICLFFVVAFAGVILAIIQMQSGIAQGHIIALSLLSVCCLLFLACIIVYFKLALKRSRISYYINDGNQYIIECTELNGKLEIYHITNYTTAERIEYILDKSCHIFTDIGWCSTLQEMLGFWQFICPPNEVFDKGITVRPYYTYKKKKKKRSKEIYYFKPFRHVLGAIYPRSITAKNGVIKKIAVQNLWERETKTQETSELFVYKNVNDYSIKIHIPRIVQDKAKENKFTLPQSYNIVFDEE